MDKIPELTVNEHEPKWQKDGGLRAITISKKGNTEASEKASDLLVAENNPDTITNNFNMENSFGKNFDEVFLFNNGKLLFCSLPDKNCEVAIVRNFGGVFRNETGSIEGRTSAKMFPSLIATIPRKVATNNCIFIPTPKGNMQNGSVSFEQGYLEKQFETVMNNVNSSNEKILLAPLWYNPISNQGHDAHNVFLSIDVKKSRECVHIVGHCIDTLDDLKLWVYPGSSLMKNDKLDENDVKGIEFIDTYILQGIPGKTCTNFTEANLFLAANLIATNPDLDYSDFFDIINSKVFQILSAKTVIDRIDPMQRAITLDSNQIIGNRYEFLPGRIITLEPENIEEELLDANTLCAICEFENLELYEVPINFNAYDGLRPKALLPLIKTLPIEQVKKLKDLFFKKIYDEYNKTGSDFIHDRGTFEEEFGISFDNFENLYINIKGYDNKSDEEIRDDFMSLVKQTKIFEVKSRSLLPPRQSKLEERNLELFNRLMQTEQRIVDNEIEIYSIIDSSIKKECFDLNNMKNIENIPYAMLYIMNNNNLNNEEKATSIQNILCNFNKDGKGILTKKKVLNFLSTKPEFGKQLYTQLDRIKEYNKKEGKPHRIVELFSEELKNDIAMAIWHPETIKRNI